MALDQVIIKRHMRADPARIALTAAAPAELAIDPAGFMQFADDHVQAAAGLPRPAMLVATVIAPICPACATIPASAAS